MIATVDKAKCIGCGLCEGTCPEVFRIGDDGLSEAYTNPIPSESIDTAQEAADGCPGQAITIEWHKSPGIAEAFVYTYVKL